MDFLVIPDGKELKTVQAIVHSIDGEKQKFSFLNWYKQFDKFFFNRKLFAAFGSLATIILIYFVINNLFYNADDKSAASILYRVSKEIAVNHNKNLGPEYYSDSFTKLNADMTSLDFTIAKPSFYENQNYNLIGSRYCTIQGNIAALLKLKDEEGNVYTLYQCTMTEDLEKINNETSENNGVKIKVWKENGLFFGLASSIK